MSTKELFLATRRDAPTRSTRDRESESRDLGAGDCWPRRPAHVRREPRGGGADQRRAAEAVSSAGASHRAKVGAGPPSGVLLRRGGGAAPRAAAPPFSPLHLERQIAGAVLCVADEALRTIVDFIAFVFEQAAYSARKPAIDTGQPRFYRCNDPTSSRRRCECAGKTARSRTCAA
jgi:hypothetical protein